MPDKQKTIRVKRIAHSLHNANAYLLGALDSDTHLSLIDIGDAKPVLEHLSPNQLITELLITHAHIDHIAGIDHLMQVFPDCVIYVSEFTKKALTDAKLNLTFYYQRPVVFESDNICIVKHGQRLTLRSGVAVTVLETPGHNAGALSFKFEDGVFTGDSLIPGTKVVTKLKSGNKQEAKRSIDVILSSINDGDWVYPGHGAPCKKYEIDTSVLV